MGLILWLVAAVLVIAGIFRIVKGDAPVGIALIVVGLLVGPGGVSVFSTVPVIPT
ncbi:MAG: GPGG-motif small membrane protein [Acidimicrobiales bacterium]|nr:GPGG-motif small membrane protein [Acidimicrobiales bacterium]